MRRLRIAFLLMSSVGLGFGALHCSSDDDPPPPNNTTPDGQVPNDAQPPQADVQADGNIPAPSPKNWKPGVFVFNVQPQPSPKIGGDPGFTIPFTQAQLPKFDPARKPDAFQDSNVAGGIGFGCVGYKFSSLNPMDPAGPNLPDGDMGDVTINGFTGGNYIMGPNTDAGIPKPIVCKRGELFPGSGFFKYSCPEAFPATGFLKPTDLIMASAAGGADLKAWQLGVPPSPNTNLEVTNDLWGSTPAMFDGTADLKFEYNCGGQPCGMAGAVAVIIESSDGRGLDASVPSPFYFPQQPAKEFGFIQCLDFLGGNKSSFTIKKEVAKVIPPSWTELRVIVGTVNPAAGQVDFQPIALGSGFARVGITHK